MKSLGFFKKEINEIIKTSKIFVLPAILLFFGFTSPLTARYMNEIIKSMGGLDIKLPETTFIDAYAQFFKNISQIGIIVMILVFMGMVVDEKVKGSAILILTKSLSRMQFILSKYVAGILLFTFAFALSAIACIYYTFLLFPTFYNDRLWLSFVMLWVYGIFIISVTLFASTLGKSHTMAAVLGFMGFAISSAVTIVPKVGEFTPGNLGGMGLAILGGTKSISDGLLLIAVSLLISIIFVFGSIVIFKKQEL